MSCNPLSGFENGADTSRKLRRQMRREALYVGHAAWPLEALGHRHCKELPTFQPVSSGWLDRFAQRFVTLNERREDIEHLARGVTTIFHPLETARGALSWIVTE